MSYRGRVIRRQPVACYAKPRAIQEQEEQLEYLSKVLRVTLYVPRNWDSFFSWASEMTQSDGWVKPRDIVSSWAGPSTARAIRVPVKIASTLDIWLNDVGKTVIPAGQKFGFLYKFATQPPSDTTQPFTWSGQTIASDKPCRITVSSTPGYPLASTILGDGYQFQRGTWVASVRHDPVTECYFVHPFFDITVVGNGEPTRVMQLSPNV